MQPEYQMPHPLRPLSRIRAWYETARYPSLILAVLVTLLYFPSVFGGFVLDDHRSLRLFEEYRRGQRQSLDLYRFLFGGESNRQARRAGWYSWWITDNLRYRHLRPVSEYVLYAEYLLFADRPIGFRLVGLALYVVGVALVLRLFRLIGGDEALARWAALFFAVAAGHAVPVVFVSNHCDLVALVLAGGAMLAVGRFIRDGRAWRLAVAAALFGLGLFAKEAVLPVAVLPLCFWLANPGEPGCPPFASRGDVKGPRSGAARAAVSAALLTACGLLWLAYYAHAGYGSNAALILDPLHAPVEYLAALPLRAVILLATWVIPLNPFFFLLHHEGAGLLKWYALVGGVILAALAVMFWRRYRRQRGVAAMALWPLPFLPLLVCTVPDDRVMVLPSIGLAFLGAVWLSASAGGGQNAAVTPIRAAQSNRAATACPLRRAAMSRVREQSLCSTRTPLRKLPLLLFVVLQIIMLCGVAWTVQFLEDEAQRDLRLMIEGFGRPLKSGDHVFFINSARNFETLFAQDRLHGMLGRSDVGVSVLADIPAPAVKIVDAHTLRLESGERPFFSSFAGLMGTSRTPPRAEGDVYDAGEFQARIASLRDGQVSAIEIRFRRPLSSDSYRFYWSTVTAPPVLAPQIHAEGQ